MARYWTCRRQKGGKRCSTRNPAIKQKCATCGGARPRRRTPKHMAALKLPYEVYLELNGGVERCGICRRPPTPGRRLDRDHEHKGNGTPRGLLCGFCNKRLSNRVTLEWLEAATLYLKRAASR